jgi:hypothetical protein
MLQKSGSFLTFDDGLNSFCASEKFKKNQKISAVTKKVCAQEFF